jgi:hypothetical protein
VSVSIFESVRTVTGWFTLAAFSIAAGLTFMLARLRNDKHFIETLPPEQRLEGVKRLAGRRYLDLSTIDFSKLTKDQTLKLALAQLDHAHKRFRTAAQIGISVFAIAAVVWVISMFVTDSRTGQYEPPTLSQVQRDSLAYHLAAGQFSRETGRLAQALTHYQQALEIDRNNPELLQIIKDIETKEGQR